MAVPWNTMPVRPAAVISPARDRPHCLPAAISLSPACRMQRCTGVATGIEMGSVVASTLQRGSPGTGSSEGRDGSVRRRGGAVREVARASGIAPLAGGGGIDGRRRNRDSRTQDAHEVSPAGTARGAMRGSGSTRRMAVAQRAGHTRTKEVAALSESGPAPAGSDQGPDVQRAGSEAAGAPLVLPVVAAP